jgi:hypothetical protein
METSPPAPPEPNAWLCPKCGSVNSRRVEACECVNAVPGTSFMCFPVEGTVDAGTGTVTWVGGEKDGQRWT